MLKQVWIALAIAGMPLVAGAQQNAEIAALGQCLGDNTTGKERKDLSKWMFLSMAAHPEIKPLAKASTAEFEQASRSTAAIFTRLIAESCVTEVRAAMKTGGSVALQMGFQVLGQLAMQELMTNTAVQGAISGFEQYVDRGKVNTAIGNP